MYSDLYSPWLGLKLLVNFWTKKIIIIFHGLFIHYLHHIVADLLGDLKVFIPRKRTNIGNTDSMVVPEIVKIVPRDSFNWLV